MQNTFSFGVPSPQGRDKVDYVDDDVDDVDDDAVDDVDDDVDDGDVDALSPVANSCNYLQLLAT